MKSLKLENDCHNEELELLHIENASLKSELSVAMSQKGQKSDLGSLGSLDISMISKSSKYPDVVCPHFKNGGQCTHCIKVWKAAQKEKKK